MQEAVLRRDGHPGTQATAGVATHLVAGNADGLLIYGGLTVPCMLFFAYLGDLPLGLAFTVVAVALTPWFRAAPSSELHATMACAIAALALTVLGGEGRLVAANFDWRIRDAVLHDLVAQPWPFVYRFAGHDWLLRAPLGMYLLPALAGKVFGQYGAALMLWAQNGIAIFIALRILSAARSRSDALVVLIVVVIFSGWDVPATLATHIGFGQLQDPGWWAGRFQYSSTITLAYWAPNHAIPGWFMAALLLLWDRRRIGVVVLAMGAALAMFWSPFALIGASPFVAKATYEALQRREISRRDLFAIAALAAVLLPVALYVVADGASVRHGFQPMSSDFWTTYLMFIGYEVLPFVLINRIVGHHGGFARSTYYAAIGVLLLLPFYLVGQGNDLVMRASIPALMIVAVTTGHSVAFALRTRHRLQLALAGSTLALGALTGLTQTVNILRVPNLGISRCDIVQAWPQHPGAKTSKAHYFAQVERLSPLLRAPAPSVHSTGATTRQCSNWRL